MSSNESTNFAAVIIAFIVGGVLLGLLIRYALV